MFGKKFKNVMKNLREIKSSAPNTITTTTNTSTLTSELPSIPLTDENIPQLINTSNHFYNKKRKNRIELKNPPLNKTVTNLSIETLNSIFFEKSTPQSSEKKTQGSYTVSTMKQTIKTKQSIENTLNSLTPIKIPDKKPRIPLLKTNSIEGLTLLSFLTNNNQDDKDIYYSKQYIRNISSIPNQAEILFHISPVKRILKYNNDQLSITPNVNSVSILPSDNKELNTITKSIGNLNEILNEKEGLLNQTEAECKTILDQKEAYTKMLIFNEYLRKKAQEYIHSIKGNIRVYCRVRPSSSSLSSIKPDTFITYPELELGTEKISTLEIKNKKANANANDTQLFNFDRIFPESTQQETIFDEIKQFVQSALDGDNICIFAYGATGSGKTFTMQGDYNSSDGTITKDSGILPRCATFIFEEKNRLMVYNESFEIDFAAIEIYNENIYDLLTNTSSNNNHTAKAPLTIYCANNTVNIPGLKWEKISMKTDIIKYTNKASESRRSDSTSFNSTSSRSHAIFQIKIVRSNGKSSMINIIDLAGSERSQMTSFSNMNKEQIDLAKKIQNEANYINKSLSALGRIINMIGDQKNSKLVIPYRESKLTIALQNYLKPNSKTVMIVNISSENKNFAFTKESLVFATNAMINC